MTTFYDTFRDYRYYIIAIILLLTAVIIYLFIREAINTGYYDSLFKARWIIPNWLIITIIFIIYFGLSFTIYYNNIANPTSRTDIINGFLILTILANLIALAGLYAFRNIVVAVGMAGFSFLLTIYLLYATYNINSANPIAFYTFLPFALFAAYFFLVTINLYIRNVKRYLPLNEASTPEAIHYEALYRKKGLCCQDYISYSPYYNPADLNHHGVRPNCHQRYDPTCGLLDTVDYHKDDCKKCGEVVLHRVK